MVFYQITIVFVLVVVVGIIHELGHVIALLMFGVPIHRLRLGMGPTIRLLSRNFKNSAIRRLRVKLIPFTLGASFDGDHPRFKNLSFWSKIWIYVFGSVFNLFSAFIVCVAVNDVKGIDPGDFPKNITRFFVDFNLISALVGLLPLPRFDGGRIFDCLAKRFLNQSEERFILETRLIVTLILSFFIYFIVQFWI